MYTDFASVYDRLMGDIDYRHWANYYIKLIKKTNPKAKNIWECSCGTGNISLYLAKKYHLIASDISEEMLNIAYQKAFKKQIKINFIKQDMRRINSASKQDAILSTCDGVNYLLSKQSVMSFFKSANRALNIGGSLIFDVSSQYKLYKLLPSRPWINFDDDISYMWQSFIEENKLYLDLSVFIKEDDLYHRIDEEQVQVCFAIPEYRQMLRKAGFGDIRVYGDKNFSFPGAKALRWHFAAIKIKEEQYGIQYY